MRMEMQECKINLETQVSPDNKESFVDQEQEFGFYFKYNGKLIGVA